MNVRSRTPPMTAATGTCDALEANIGCPDRRRGCQRSNRDRTGQACKEKQPNRNGGPAAGTGVCPKALLDSSCDRYRNLAKTGDATLRGSNQPHQNSTTKERAGKGSA